MALSKEQKRKRIKRRIRKNIYGTAQRPRLSVFRSNKQIYAQLINDDEGVTLASASSKNEKSAQNIAKLEQAKLIGKAIADAAQKAGIENCVFDRNGYIYHGRVKALAEGAREAGLKF